MGDSCYREASPSTRGCHVPVSRIRPGGPFPLNSASTADKHNLI